MIWHYDNDSHQIRKGDQGRCHGCNWSTLDSCEKCNISLRPECINRRGKWREYREGSMQHTAV